MDREYDPPSLNKYIYARTDPINFIDPDGRRAVCITDVFGFDDGEGHFVATHSVTACLWIKQPDMFRRFFRKGPCGPLLSERILEERHKTLVESLGKVGERSQKKECSDFIQGVIDNLRSVHGDRIPYRTPTDIVSKLGFADYVINPDDEDSSFCRGRNIAEASGTYFISPATTISLGADFFAGQRFFGDRTTVLLHEGFHLGTNSIWLDHLGLWDAAKGLVGPPPGDLGDEQKFGWAIAQKCGP